MSSVKKRKVVDERMVFQRERTEISLLIEERRKPFGLKCKNDASSYEKGKFKTSLRDQPS